MKTRKVKKHIKFNFQRFLVLFAAVASALILAHDFIIWGIIPFFTKDYIMLTYSGMVLDFVALCTLELTSQMIKEW